MNNKLKDFWEWFQKTPEQYAMCELQYIYNHMEYDYPEYQALIDFATQVVDNNTKNEDDIYDLLTIMALDNESENILDYIEDNSTDEQIQIIIKLGMSHLQPHARWQIAELLYRRKPKDYLCNLIILSIDNNSYVSQRALNCIESSR